MSLIDAALFSGFVYVWNVSVPYVNKAIALFADDVAIPTPEAVAKTQIEQICDIFRDLHWGWHLLAAFVFYCVFQGPIDKLVALSRLIADFAISTIKKLMAFVCGLAAHAARAHAARAAHAARVARVEVPATPAPAAPKKARAKSPAHAAPKKARAKSPARKESGIQVGTHVLARYPGFPQTKRFAATVKFMNQDGTCVIAWDDGDVNHTTKNTQDLLLNLD